MNYWPRWIRAIRGKTLHLSMAQMGAYDRLLDYYYEEEKPLPASLDACARICGASSKQDRADVASVLAQFFILGDAGYAQQRADEEIVIGRAKIAAAQTNGKAGGRPSGSKKKHPKEPTGFPLGSPAGTQDESEREPGAKAPHHQSSSPTSKKRGDTPLKPPAWSAPEWVPEQQWADFVAHRRAMRSVPFTDAARDGVIRELAALTAKGHDAADLLSTAITRGWRTVFEPKHVGGGASVLPINRQEALEARNRAVGDAWLREQEAMDAAG